MKARLSCAGLLVIVAVILVGGLGCASNLQFRTLSNDLTKLRVDLEAARDESRNLALADKESQAKLAELEKKIREESVRVDILVEKLASLGAAAPGVRGGNRPPSPPARSLPSFDPRALYGEGQSLAASGDFAAAILRLEQMAALFPRDPLADDARFAVGSLYFEQRDYSRALEHYVRVVTDYPDSDRFQAAALQAALCYEHLGDLVKERAILEELVRRYPDTPEGRQAEELLGKMGPAKSGGSTTGSRDG